MTNQISGSIEHITPEKAIEYLRHNSMNRVPNARTIEFYADMMKRGQWKSNGEPIIFAEDGTLLDGQQRLYAVIKAGIGLDFFVVRGVEKTAMPTIDTGKSRNAGNVCQIAGITNAVSAAAIARGIILLRKGKNNMGGGSNAVRKISNIDLLNVYYENEDIIRETSLAIDRGYRKQKVLTKAVAGALCAWLIIDKKHDKEKVFRFFDMLYTGKDITPAVYTLREELIKLRDKRIHMRPKEEQNMIAKAWNSYIDGSIKKGKRYKKNEIVEFK